MNVRKKILKKYNILLIAVLFLLSSIPGNAKMDNNTNNLVPISIDNTDILICNQKTGKEYYSFSDKTDNKEEASQQLSKYGLYIK